MDPSGFFSKGLANFVGPIKMAAEKFLETKFVMVEPMQRPAVDWYTDGLANFTKMHNESLFGLQLGNISIIKREDLPSEMFAADYVHLTQSAGIQFLSGHTCFQACNRDFYSVFTEFAILD